jgi:uncharacterized protein
LECLPAWAEHEWLGREITIGAAQLRAVSAITPYPATQVNPSSAERDLDILGTLQRTFGHNLMGVYGEALHAGEMAVGDPITVANT